MGLNGCIGSMSDEKDKKFAHVNGFKAPEDWYARVQEIAEQRGTTIGGAIQYIFDLGLPIYEEIRRAEKETIQKAYARASKLRTVEGTQKGGSSR